MTVDKPLSKLTTDDISVRLGISDMRVYLTAALGVLRMKECELQRAHVAHHFAEYNYHGAKLAEHQRLLAAAQESNRTGVDA